MKRLGAPLALLLAVLASTRLAYAEAAPLGEPAESSAEDDESEYPGPLPDNRALEPTLRRALRQGDDFCGNPERPLEVEDRPLCPLASASRARCPEFARACEEYAKHLESARPRRNPASDLTRFLGGVLTVLFWVVLGVGLLGLLATLVGALVRRRAEAPESASDSPARRAQVHAATIQEAVDPAVLLAAARDLAERGLFKEGMAQALRALLRGLEVRGVLELSPARTNGDYARRLRGKGVVEEEFRALAHDVEAVEFGGRAASRERFAAVHARVERLIGGGAAALLVVCVLGLSACGAPAQKSSSLGTCGDGPKGYSAFCELLALEQIPAKLRFQPLDALPEDVRQVVVLTDTLSVAERAVLIGWVERGGLLIIKDRIDVYAPADTVQRAAPSTSCGDALALADDRKLPSGAAPRFRMPGVRPLVADSASVLVRCAGGAFAAWTRRGTGAVVSVADPRFFTNAALAIDDNAVLALRLTTNTPTLLVGEWTGAGSDLPLRSITRAGLLPWLLHVLVLGLAFALYRGAPFGSRRELVRTPRRAFVEHVEALGGAYARAHASGIALFHYGSYAIERLRARAGAGGQTRLDALGRALSGRLPVREAEVTKLIVAVRFAGDEKNDSGTEGEHLAAMRELGDLVTKAGK